MALQTMKVPTYTPPKRFELNEFKGVDFSSYSGAISKQRSPLSENMISAQNGQVVTRKGYQKIYEYAGLKINGIYSIKIDTTTYTVIHAGTKIYVNNVLKFSAMADSISTGFLSNGKLYILDGSDYYVFDGTTFQTVVSAGAYIPLTIILRASGTTDQGGKAYEDVNLLQSRRKNRFKTVTGAQRVYQLNFAPLDSTGSIIVKVLESGNWVTKTEGTHYTVNRTTATITFTSDNAISAEDNVEIEAPKTVSGYADRIKKCDIHTMFGISSYNQVFVSGNPNLKNYIYYTAYNGQGASDPTYFPDSNYVIVGQSSTSVMGFRKSGQYLVIIKENNFDDATAFLLQGEIKTDSDGNSKFQCLITQGITGVGAVSKRAFADLRDDHLFLSNDGVFAIATNVVQSEKYAAARSSLINRKLTKHDLSKACMTVCKGYLYLCVDNVCYVADAMLKNYEGKGAETYNYEWFYWTNIPARVITTINDEVWFGAENGKVMKFYQTEDASSYTDDGAYITSFWCTPTLDFDYGDMYKTIRHIFIRLLTQATSSVKCYIYIDDLWELMDTAELNLFDFDDINFDDFSFVCSSDDFSFAIKVAEKNVVVTQFKFESTSAFGIQNAVVQYEIKNKLK